MQTDLTALGLWSLGLSILAVLLAVLAVWLNRTGPPPAPTPDRTPPARDECERCVELATSLAEMTHRHAHAVEQWDNAVARANGLEHFRAAAMRIAAKPWYWHAWADARYRTERVLTAVLARIR